MIIKVDLKESPPRKTQTAVREMHALARSNCHFSTAFFLKIMTIMNQLEYLIFLNSQSNVVGFLDPLGGFNLTAFIVQHCGTKYYVVKQLDPAFRVRNTLSDAFNFTFSVSQISLFQSYPGDLEFFGQGEKLSCRRNCSVLFLPKYSAMIVIFDICQAFIFYPHSELNLRLFSDKGVN